MIDGGLRVDPDEKTMLSLVTDFADYLASWVLSAQLEDTPEWRRQVEESEVAVKSRKKPRAQWVSMN